MSNDVPNSSKCDELIRSCGNMSAVDDEQQENDRPAEPVLVKRMKLENNVEVDVVSQVNIINLPSDVWRILLPKVPDSDVVSLSSVCTHFQQIVQDLKSCYNLSKNYHLDAECFINYALSQSCTSVNINYCKWLMPSTIKGMISKTNLRHLHLIRCQVNEDCVRSICNLQLQSLSFTYTNEWRSYFIENVEKSLSVFQSLTKLEIEFCTMNHTSLDLKNKTFIFDIYANVLQYCKQLQHLKLFDDFNKLNDDYNSIARPSEFPSQSTSLLKLASLEFDFKNWDCKMDLDNFLKAILKDKVIPLKHINFGQFTCFLILQDALPHPLILPQSEFILRSYNRFFFGDEHYHFYDHYEVEYSNWIGQTIYETVFVEYITFVDFASFANRVISSSGKSITKIYIRYCLIARNVEKGIELFSINCPHLTVLHLTINGDGVGSIRDINFVQNEAILESMTNFKNLQELVISPEYLKCDFKNEDGSQLIKIMPLWKVTKGCEQLIKIHLKHSNNDYHLPTIHADSLYAIAFCKNLKELKLSNFKVRADRHFQLSEVTKSCTKLDHLSIINVIIVGDYILNFTESLRHIKDLKILRIKYGKKYLTETFLNSLCFCEQLEDITLNLCENIYELKYKYLMKVLPKLKNLFVFGIEVDDPDEVITEYLNSLFEKIKYCRPAFSSSIIPNIVHI